jgi:hypothetical protein
MPFVSSDQVLDRLAEILSQHFEKRRKELTNGPEKPAPVRKWSIDEHDFPAGADRGDFPKGVVGFTARTSERREQDTGETAEFDLTVRIYFRSDAMTKADAETTARRYGDAVVYTVQREGLGKRPSDGTVIPGLFRFWPRHMKPGLFEEIDCWGCEVDVHAIVDSSFSASV